MPFISVIIPSHNRKNRLIRAMESVLAQTYTDFEMAVVDDGSTDGSFKAVRSNFRDNSIRYITLPHNCGVSRARNEGVAHTSAPWIAFLDSDDIWHPEKLEKQYKWIQKHPSIRILQTRELWIRNGKRVNPPRTHQKTSGDIFAVSLQRCMITPSSVILQRSLFEEMGGFNESLPACEDYDLWLRIADTYPVGLIDEYLLTRFGGHPDQLSSCVPSLDRFRIRSMLDLLTGGGMDREHERLVREMLTKKAMIVANGYKKRGNIQLFEQYKTIAEKYGYYNNRY